MKVEADLPKMIYPDVRNNHSRSKSLIITIFILTIVFAVAAIKNPSQTESRNQIKLFLVERLNAYEAKKTLEDADSDNSEKVFGRFIMSAFASTLIDTMVQIKTSDYLFFSSFEAKLKNEGEHKKIVSGVIVFGKILPLSTDFDADKLKEEGFALW